MKPKTLPSPLRKEALLKGAAQRGQILLEFNLALLLVVLPLLAGALAWYTSEWSRSKCAHQTFNQARAKLIQTNLAVELTSQCAPMSETVKLVPLDTLDQNGGGLDVGDAVREASRLLEDASSFVSSSSPSDYFN